MSKLKVLTVLRSRILRTTKIAHKALSKEGSGMLWTFSAEGFFTIKTALESLPDGVMLDNGAFLSREQQEVLSGRMKLPPYYATLIECKSVEKFIEPDIVAPDCLFDALETSLKKANEVYKFLDPKVRTKAVRPIQGTRVSAHMKWFEGYTPKDNLNVRSIAFGGLGSYGGSENIRDEVMATSKILVRDYGVESIHLLGSTSIDTIELAEDLSTIARDVSFDSSTVSYATYGAGEILLPSEKNKKQKWIPFRRRFTRFSQQIEDSLSLCVCEACKFLRLKFRAEGFCQIIERHYLYCDPPDEITDLIFLHNAETFAEHVRLRAKR